MVVLSLLVLLVLLFLQAILVLLVLLFLLFLLVWFSHVLLVLLVLVLLFLSEQKSLFPLRLPLVRPSTRNHRGLKSSECFVQLGYRSLPPAGLRPPLQSPLR